MSETKAGRVTGEIEGAPIEPMAISIPQAARAINVGRSTFYKMIAAGEIETVKIGKRHVVPVAPLRAKFHAA